MTAVPGWLPQHGEGTSHLLAVLRAFRPLAGQTVAATLLDIAQRGGIAVSQDESTEKLVLRLHRDQLPALTPIESLLVDRLFGTRTEYGPSLPRVELFDVDEKIKDAAIRDGYLRRINEIPFILGVFGIVGALVATFAGLAAADDPPPALGFIAMVLMIVSLFLLGAVRKSLAGPTVSAESALSDAYAANPDSLFFRTNSMDVGAIRAWVEAQPAQPAWWQASWPPATASANVAKSIKNFAVDCSVAIVASRQSATHIGGGGGVGDSGGGGDGGGGGG